MQTSDRARMIDFLDITVASAKVAARANKTISPSLVCSTKNGGAVSFFLKDVSGDEDIIKAIFDAFDVEFYVFMCISKSGGENIWLEDEINETSILCVGCDGVDSPVSRIIFYDNLDTQSSFTYISESTPASYRGDVFNIKINKKQTIREDQKKALRETIRKRVLIFESEKQERIDYSGLPFVHISGTSIN